MEAPNLFFIEQLADGDSTVKNKLLEILIEEFPKEREEFNTAKQRNDLKEAAQLVHKIKHKINLLGLHNSYEEANTFENNLLENKMKGVEEFEKTLEIIASFLDTMKE